MLEPTQEPTLPESTIGWSGRPSTARNVLLGRPVGVVVIAGLNSLAGAGLLIAACPYVLDFLAYQAKSPSERNVGDSWAIVGGVAAACVLPPFAMVFILAAVGLWLLRRWALIFASISAILVLVWGVVMAIQGLGRIDGLVGFLSWGLPGLLFMATGAAMLVYLAQRKVRTQFG